jgi:hypothetical protein
MYIMYNVLGDSANLGSLVRVCVCVCMYGPTGPFPGVGWDSGREAALSLAASWALAFAFVSFP